MSTSPAATNRCPSRFAPAWNCSAGRLTLVVLAIGTLIGLVVAVGTDTVPADDRRADAAAVPNADTDRSPVDLVLSADETWLVTANQTSHTVSLVRTADGRLLDEIPVGTRPAAVALCLDGRHVLVSGSRSNDVTLLEVRGERLLPVAAIPVGCEPCGVAVSPDGGTAYVALTAEDRVAVVDLNQRQVVRRIDVGRWPRHLAVSPDGSRLVVGASGSRGVTIVDTAAGRPLRDDGFRGLNLGQMQFSSDGRHVYFPWMFYGDSPTTAGNIRRGWVMASRLARLSVEGDENHGGLSLDPRGRAVSDPHGVAVSPDESRIVVTASGTGELLLLDRMAELPWLGIGGSEHMDRDLAGDRDRFARIPLGGRPLAVRIARDNRTAWAANYLANSVQVVDLQQRAVVRAIDLGGPAEPSLERRGEAIFFDATRSLEGWYSCHSCHFEGGGNATTIDTLNDGTTFTYKTVLPLFALHETGPWFWHGWQEDLHEALSQSFTSTMRGPAPGNNEIAALAAYLATLEPPPNPHRRPGGGLSPAAERGRSVFRSETAGCASCHSGTHFTDGGIHDVGLGSPNDRYEGFNTPTLWGVYRKTHLLHDGRVRTLEDLLTGPHAPEKVTGRGALSDDERRDLIEYLKSL